MHGMHPGSRGSVEVAREAAASRDYAASTKTSSKRVLSCELSPNLLLTKRELELVKALESGFSGREKPEKRANPA